MQHRPFFLAYRAHRGTIFVLMFGLPPCMKLRNIDGFVKSRHPGENRDPVFCKYLKFLDTYFRGHDDFAGFSTFYESVNIYLLWQLTDKYKTC